MHSLIFLLSITLSITLSLHTQYIQVLVQSWTESERIHPKNKIKSFPLTNKEALQNGCLTAKAQREYSKHNAVMKQNPKSLIYKRNTTTLTEQMKKNQIVYGIKSFANDATMTELLRCTGGNTQNDQEMDYPDRSRMQKKGRLPPAKSTKSSRLLQEFTKPMSKECVAYIKAKEEFKMKKFMNVKSKVKSIRKGFDLTHHTHHTHHKQEVQI